MAAIGVLADLFASGSRDGQAGPQLLACLLRKQPAAVSLIMCSGSCLQERIACFLGELGFSPQELAARLQQQWALLTGTPEQLAALEAMLQRELGVDRRLFCKLLTRMPRVVGCSLRTVQRILALVAMSGDGTWCSGHPADVVRNLHVADAEPTRLCLAIALPAGAWPGAGAACSSHCTPAAFGQHCRVAASPGGVAAMRRGRSNSCGAQQRSNALPGLAGTGAAGQPAGVAAQHGAVTGVYEQFGSYVANSAAEKLAGRLLYLEQRGLLHLLVADKQAAKAAWREKAWPASHQKESDRRVGIHQRS